MRFKKRYRTEPGNLTGLNGEIKEGKHVALEGRFYHFSWTPSEFLGDHKAFYAAPPEGLDVMGRVN